MRGSDGPLRGHLIAAFIGNVKRIQEQSGSRVSSSAGILRRDGGLELHKQHGVPQPAAVDLGRGTADDTSVIDDGLLGTSS